MSEVNNIRDFFCFCLFFLMRNVKIAHVALEMYLIFFLNILFEKYHNDNITKIFEKKKY